MRICRLHRPTLPRKSTILFLPPLLRLHLLVDNIHLRMLLARERIQRVDRFSDCVVGAAKQRGRHWLKSRSGIRPGRSR